MRWVMWTVVLGLIAAVGLSWNHVSPYLRLQPTAAAPTAAPPPSEIFVEAAPVKLGTLRREIEAVGTLRSAESVMVRPEIAGRVVEILFDEGEKVERGTPLIRLDSAIARAQVEQQNASLALSRVNHERAADLMRKGVGSSRAHDEAVAKLRTDEASLALAEATLEKFTLVAPFDGILGLRRISVGDYLNPGQDIVNLESIDTLKVDFRIPEIYAMHLKVGQTIRVTLDAVPGMTYEGKVYAIDPAHDPNGRAIVLRARIPNGDGLLRPGMFARVMLIVDWREQRILLSETTIVPKGDEHFVFRVADGKAKLTKIKIGQRRGGNIEVIEGLTPESIVVTEGALKLRDGAAVRANIANAD